MSEPRAFAGAPQPEAAAVEVLHLDDSSRDAELVRERLVQEEPARWRIFHVATRDEFERALEARGYDLILTDYSIPGYDGITAVQAAHRLHPDVPIIVISGTVSEEEAVAALRAGAIDYVFKQRLGRLAPAARRAIADAAERRRRVQAEQEAHRKVVESEQRFRATFEQAAVGVTFISFQGRRLRVNQRYCEILGYTAEELMGGVQVTHPDDLEAARLRRAALEQGSVSANRALKRYVRKDGAIVWCDVTNSLMRDAEDRPAYILSVIQDVTDRVVAQQRLAETEELLRSAISSMAEGLVVTDGEGRILTANPSAGRILGFPAGELVGRLTVDPAFIPLREDGTPFPAGERPTARALASGQPQVDVVMGVRRAGGEQAWLLLNATPLPAAGGGRPRGVVLTFRDITDERRAQREIRELNASLERKVEERTRALATETAKLWAVLDTAADAIITIDERGIVLDVNRAAETMLRYGRDEMVGGNVSRLMPDSEARQHDAGLASYLRIGEGRVIGSSGREVQVRRKDGSVFPARLSISEGMDGGRRFFTGILHDITELKDRERQVLRLNADLEERAAQAEAANRELEAFSYSVSHDLRAPLHAISGFADALGEHSLARLDERGRHFLGRIRAGAERMDTLIEDLLSLARISSADLIAHEVDLASLARETMAELAEREPQRKLRFSVAPGLRAYGDTGLLRVALTNLLGNAWKFSRDREEAVIEVGRETLEGAEVIYVRDNGAGFDPSQASRIFGAFQRLHGHSEFPGTGIGLATVRRVIERHGGQVWAEGAPGKGATFRFSLPGKGPG
ncbi:MAG TPA: PAS domain S-box protein [Usitatibacter sp.]|nr:PAS domain S-box protein [Usitatibacter sp.]